MEPISTLGIYLVWVVAGSSIIHYVAETQSVRIYNNMEIGIRNRSSM